jgi:hypothetical protein
MSETRNTLDLPGIDGIEDLDGDVDGLDVHLDDLTPGDVVTVHAQEDSTEYVVTGRHESAGKTIDETDVIELTAIDPSDALLSHPMSVASMHHRALLGEIEIETGLRGIATWLIGRGSYHLRTIWKYRIRGHDDLSDTCDGCGESVNIGRAYSGPDDRPYHKECLADPSKAVKWPDVSGKSDSSDVSDQSEDEWTMTFTGRGGKRVPATEVESYRITSVCLRVPGTHGGEHGEDFWVVDRIAGRWYCLACHDAHCEHAWAVENELPDPTPEVADG